MSEDLDEQIEAKETEFSPCFGDNPVLQAFTQAYIQAVKFS